MKFTNIDGNGNFQLTVNQASTQSPEVTVYIPADIGSAVLTIGYIDDNGSTVPYTDGAILVGEQKRIRCGSGVDLVITVSGYSTQFSIGYAS